MRSNTFGSFGGLAASPGRGPGRPVTMFPKTLFGGVLIRIVFGVGLGVKFDDDTNGGVLRVTKDTLGVFVVFVFGRGLFVIVCRLFCKGPIGRVPGLVVCLPIWNVEGAR